MNTLVSLAGWVWEASWQASLILLVVLAVQGLLGSRISAAWRHAFWFVVVARLLLPGMPQSGMSAYNYTHSPQQMVFDRISSVIVMPLRKEDAPQILTNEENKSLSMLRLSPDFLKETVPWEKILASIWLLGTGVMVGRLFFFYHRFRRRLAQDARPAERELCALLGEAATKLQMRTPGLLQTHLVSAPAVVGLLHPTILVPPEMSARFNAEEMRHVFLHELAHLKRGDLWTNWLLHWLRATHWFNPFLWFGFRRMRADCELACDELALKDQNSKARRQYGETLLKVLSGLHREPSRIGMVGILENQGRLKRRMEQIARVSAKPWFAPFGCLLIAGAIALSTLTSAKQKQETFSPENTSQTAASLPLPPIGKSTQWEMSAIFLEVSADISPQDKALLERLIREGKDFELRKLSGKGVDILAMPMVTSKLETPATFNVTKEFRYPTKYAKAENGEFYPTDFETREVGLELEKVKCSVGNRKIFLQGKMKITLFKGFIEDDPHFRQPVFEIKEGQLFRQLENGKTVGFWIPGEQIGSDSPLSVILNKPLLEQDKGAPLTKRMAVFLTVKIVDYTPPTGKKSETLRSLASVKMPTFVAEKESLETVVARLGKEWETHTGSSGEKSLIVNYEQRPYPTVTLNLHDVSILEILQAIEKTTGYQYRIDPFGNVSLYFPPQNAPRTSPQASTANSASTPLPLNPNLPYGAPVEGKPGFVTSPYAPKQGEVDVRGFPPGTEVKDPYTGKVFLVP